MNRPSEFTPKRPTRRLSDLQFQVVVGAAAALLMLVIIPLRFCSDVSVPSKPPRPNVVLSGTLTDEFAKSARAFRSKLQRDASRYKLATVSVDDMSRRLFHRSHTTPIKLKLGGPAASAAGLKLSAKVVRSAGPTRRVITLTIENPTDSHLAYRVQTRLTSVSPKICLHREPMNHHAVAIAPGERIVRGECSFERAWRTKFIVTRVDTAVLPALSYYYVSALPPKLLSLDKRTARHHTPGISGIEMCSSSASHSFHSAVERGEISWLDIIDYYARHDCHRYTRFPLDYRAFAKDFDRKLPVVAD